MIYDICSRVGAKGTGRLKRNVGVSKIKIKNCSKVVKKTRRCSRLERMGGLNLTCWKLINGFLRLLPSDSRLASAHPERYPWL